MIYNPTYSPTRDIKPDDDTEYDVDGVYTAKDLADDIRRILASVRFEYEKRLTSTMQIGQLDHITSLIEDHFKRCEL